MLVRWMGASTGKTVHMTSAHSLDVVPCFPFFMKVHRKTLLQNFEEDTFGGNKLELSDPANRCLCCFVAACRASLC